jgi:hypothetical protein
LTDELGVDGKATVVVEPVEVHLEGLVALVEEMRDRKEAAHLIGAEEL